MERFTPAFVLPEDPEGLIRRTLAESKGPITVSDYLGKLRDGVDRDAARLALKHDPAFRRYGRGGGRRFYIEEMHGRFPYLDGADPQG